MNKKIDIKKYEGHTPVWYLHGETGAWWVQSDFTTHDDFVVAEVRSENDADAQLLADAPLILAEYKKLRKAYEVMGEALRENGTDYCEHCLRVYCDTSDEVLYRHREGRCLT